MLISFLLQIFRSYRWQLELSPLEHVPLGRIWVVTSVAYMAIDRSGDGPPDGPRMDEPFLRADVGESVRLGAGIVLVQDRSGVAAGMGMTETDAEMVWPAWSEQVMVNVASRESCSGEKTVVPPRC